MRNLLVTFAAVLFTTLAANAQRYTRVEVFNEVTKTETVKHIQTKKLEKALKTLRTQKHGAVKVNYNTYVLNHAEHGTILVTRAHFGGNFGELQQAWGIVK